MKKVLVSSCLLGINCKYNGKNNYNESLVSFLKNYDVISICPECMGGLPIPRIPSEVNSARVINKNGEDVTENFLKGANLALEVAIKNECKVAILKKNSPSCGFGTIYDGTFNSKLTNGNGITAQLLYNNGIVILNEDNFIEELKKDQE